MLKDKLLPKDIGLEDATDLVIDKQANWQEYAGDHSLMLIYSNQVYLRDDTKNPPMYEMLNYGEYILEKSKS